jgi:hypothetical protein
LLAVAGGCAASAEFVESVSSEFGYWGIVILFCGLVVGILWGEFLLTAARNEVANFANIRTMKRAVRGDNAGLTVAEVVRLYSLYVVDEREKERLLVEGLVAIGRRDMEGLLDTFDRVRPYWLVRLCYEALGRLKGGVKVSLLKERLLGSATVEVAKARLANVRKLAVRVSWEPRSCGLFVLESFGARGGGRIRVAALDGIAGIRERDNILAVDGILFFWRA